MSWRALALALVLATWLGTPLTARAVSAYPGAVGTVEPDGSSVEVVLHGDERFSCETTPDGLLVQSSPETGETCYVVSTGDSLALGVPVASGETPEGAVTYEELGTDELRRAYKGLGGTTWEPMDEHEFALVAPDELAPVAPPPAKAGADSPARTAGPSTGSSLPLLVVVVGFEGTPASTEYDWGSAIFSEDGSVTQYYNDMSGGAFTFVPAAETYEDAAVHDAANDGVVHVTLDSHTHGNWFELSDNASRTQDTNGYMLGAFSAALSATDGAVDFSAYDTNGDGVIQTNELAICLVVAGYEGSHLTASAAAGDAPVMWSHAWALSGDGTDRRAAVDGVLVDEYIAVSEQLSKNPKTGADAIREPLGVVIHELGHYLGLVDLYANVSKGPWSPYAVSHLSLMANGEWGRVPSGEYVPAGLDAWSRYQLGWIHPLELTLDDLTDEGTDYTVASQLADGGYQAVLVHVSDTEYFLIENRQAEGHDAGLVSSYGKYPSGVVVWHVDTSMLGDDYVNDADERPAVMPVFAEYANGELALSSEGGTPSTWQALWSTSLWRFVTDGDPEMTRLYLSAYEGAETPGERTYAGVWIEFLTAPGRVMTVRLGTSDENPYDFVDDEDDDEDDFDDEDDDEDDDFDDEDYDDEDYDYDDEDYEDDEGDLDEHDYPIAIPSSLPGGEAIDKDRTPIATPAAPSPAPAPGQPLPRTGEGALPVEPLLVAGVACLICVAYRQKSD